MITTTKQGEREREKELQHQKRPVSSPPPPPSPLINTRSGSVHPGSPSPEIVEVAEDIQLNFTFFEIMRHHHHHHHHLFLVLLLFLGTLFEPFLWSSSSSSGVGVAAYKVKHTTDPSFECSGCARTRLIGCFNNLCSYRCYRSCTNGTGVVIGKRFLKF